MTEESSGSQFNLDKGWKNVDDQAREIVASDGTYNSIRMDAFVKRACRPACLGIDSKPMPQDRHTFINSLLAKHIEVTDGLDTLDKTRESRIAELAFIMDGLQGMEYSELGRLYRPSVKLVGKEGAYIMWQRVASNTAKLAKGDLEESTL